MPPLAELTRPAWSVTRKIGMFTLRAYLVIAVILLVVKVIQLAFGHWAPATQLLSYSSSGSPSLRVIVGAQFIAPTNGKRHPRRARMNLAPTELRRLSP